MGHKAGFVNILGNPNVGKSTLMNALTGEKLSVVTPKMQTTRHRILGIVNGDGYQIVFSDTPGILKPAYKLHDYMMHTVKMAVEDADVLLYVVEAGEKNPEMKYIDLIKESVVPVFLIINKIDIRDKSVIDATEQAWTGFLPNAKTFRVSALKQLNTGLILSAILEVLPESEPYYPADQLTDRSERFFIEEIIREKILLNYRKEIPYCSEVAIDSFKEEADITRISAYIFVARESQKAIILGHKGAAIRKLGIDARKDIERFLNKHVYLELTVKVSRDWRDSELQLKRFGYEL